MKSGAFLLSLALLLLLQISSTPTGVALAATPGYTDRYDEDYDDDSSDDFDDDDSEDDDSEDDEYDNEYEVKMERALSYHASKSRQLLERASLEGGFAASAEVGPDGELWQLEFTMEELDRQMEVIQSIRNSKFRGSPVSKRGAFTQFSDHNWALYDPDNPNLPLLKDDPELKAILDEIDDEVYRNQLYTGIQEKADHKSELDPEQWHNFAYWDLQAWFSCRRVMALPQPVYDKEKWDRVRQLYQDFLKGDRKDRSYERGTNPNGRTFQFSDVPFDPPMIPYFAGGEEGRSLKAGRDILEGELVFRSTNNTVIYTVGHTWRKFLFAVDEKFDTKTTCDILVWSWVQAIEKDGPLVIVSDFDNGSLLNEGRKDDPDYDQPNVRCGKEGDTMCMMEYYATEDIKEGDELLCDYRDFALLWSWDVMGL